MNERRARVGSWLTSRLQKSGWTFASMALCVLVFTALPGSQIRLGQAELRGLVGSYLYAVHVQMGTPEGLRVTELHLPRRIKIEWEYADGPWVYQVRKNGDMVVSSTTNKYWIDTIGEEDGVVLQDGTEIDYEVRVVPNPDPNYTLPAPPEGAASEDIATVYDASEWEKLHVVLRLSPSLENQTVDSRIDKRYSTVVRQDFQFGTRAYRGGLYVGYSADPSRVGRSFMKFQEPTWPETSFCMAGSVNAYHTRSWTNGSVTLRCQAIDSTWDQSAVKWTTQPGLTPGLGLSYTVTYDKDNPPADATTRWAHWDYTNPIRDALETHDPLSVALTSSNENANGWAYLAKPEYDTALSPRLAFAYHRKATAPAPSNLSATMWPSLTEVRLQWTVNTGQRGIYTIQRKPAGGTYSDVATSIPAEMDEHDDNTVISGVTYTYRIRFDTLLGGLVLYSDETTIAVP